MKRTAKQIEASRANGKKSRGPVTPEGKARSAQNSIRHGLTSQVVVLRNEDESEFAHLLECYLAEFQPATQPERDLVEDYVAARWRLHRNLALEAASLDYEIDRQRTAVDQQHSSVDEETRCALAAQSLLDSGRGLAHFSRHEARLRRAMRRALEDLRELRNKNCTDEPGGEQAPTLQLLAS